MPDGLMDNILASSIVIAVLLLVMGAVYFVWQAVSLKKKQKYFKTLHEELAPGQEVLFGGGIFGTVKEVEGDRIAVKVRSGAVLDVSRYSVQKIEK